MDLERFYLDYNATSPLSQSVSDWLKSGDLFFGNSSSQHSAGKAARKIINGARAALYSTYGLSEESHSLFFHSGATEGIVTFAHSFSEWARHTGKDLLICYSKRFFKENFLETILTIEDDPVSSVSEKVEKNVIFDRFFIQGSNSISSIVN
jgi:hypothetical protein